MVLVWVNKYVSIVPCWWFIHCFTWLWICNMHCNWKMSETLNIIHNQGGLLWTFVSFIDKKTYFNIQTLWQSACCSCPHPNREVAWISMYPYGNTKDGYLWFQIVYAIHRDSSTTDMKYINQNCTSIYVQHTGVMNTLPHVSICP